MKTLSLVCVFMMSLLVSPSIAGAVEYCIDLLEPGNPGGKISSLQTFDDSWNLDVGQEVDMDIWICGMPETLITGGVLLDYDPLEISIVNAEVYEWGLPIAPEGPWDPEFSVLFPDYYGQGSYFISCANHDTVSQGLGGAIVIAKVRLRRIAEGNSIVTLSTIPELDTFHGASVPTFVYDPLIPPETILEACSTDADCDDSNPCTDDSCNGGLCQYAGNTDPCNYGSVCTTNDYCENEICQPGESVDCDDDNVCTEDACDPEEGCVYQPNSASCNDDLFCNGDDTCSTGSCSQHEGDPCPPDTICGDGKHCLSPRYVAKIRKGQESERRIAFFARLRHLSDRMGYFF